MKFKWLIYCLQQSLKIKIILLKTVYSLFLPLKEEERKRELEEERRRENDIVFRAWLQKKKEQLQEEKRIRRAKQMEELSIKVRSP